MEQRKRLSKSELKDVLLKKVDQWIKDGNTPEDAIGKLTERQYDFLVDMGVDFDRLLLTPEQIKNAQTIKRASRSCSPNGYNKKYPKTKQDLYTGIVEYLKTQNATIVERPKQNYRDIDFSIGDITYRIVLSNPRK